MQPGPNTVKRNFKATEEQYHKMVEEVEDYAILMLDPDGIVVNWNRGAEKIKGYTEQEIVGRHFRAFYTREDQVAGLPEKLINEAKLSGKAVHEGWRVRKDGTKFWGSVVITALHDSDNAIVGFSKVTRDLTERKATEDKLKQYAAQLESQNMELQQFAYAAAHDMKEPLRKIQFYYSSILENSENLSAEKQRTYLLRAAESAKRMQGLIDDLLAYTRVSEQDERFELVDLKEVFEEVAAFYQDAVMETSALFSYDALPVIKGVPFQVRQLFMNLVSNSLKYHYPGRQLEIRLSAETIDNPQPEKESEYAAKQFYRISLRDNGIGFDAMHSEKIFGLFERLHGRDSYAGTGIGLSICKKIMDNHHGFIRATGVPGEGALFELYFPAT
ncbi:sensor histidine kinase [Deminuibacter soli]|uniref:histidine kinase n=1 Tax=Deminuibacter soli TaxID=2291815 RepID=A0A3E1NCU8_9BACT|nr:PAS domain S-box protein [Deminuibacter soli]RFM25783.1 PAS domain S-box protein [Deminuibacter soli]